jgi:thiol-disulfide isomerase/thioredoxin
VFALAACLVISGCNDTTTTSTPVEATPAQVLNPEPTATATPKADTSQAPAADQATAPAAKPEGEPADAKTPAPEAPKPEASSSTSASPAPVSAKPESAEPPLPAVASPTPAAPAGAVALVPVKYEEMLSRIAANKQAKLTMVDAWATWCGPCKENFPHVVAMNAKYAGKGLAVISLSLDDPTNTKAVDEAKKFLAEKNATFTNFLLNETQDDGFEKLNTNAIPAVFLFGPDGKEIKRFTMDDPNKQFTYDEVEKTVAEMLEGK